MKRLSNATVKTIKASISLSMCINFAAIVLPLHTDCLTDENCNRIILLNKEDFMCLSAYQFCVLMAGDLFHNIMQMTKVSISAMTADVQIN